MTVYFLFQRTKGGPIDKFEVDATIREEPQFTSQVTAFPIEEGVVISDAVLHEPERITFEVFVTNTPLKIGAGGNRVQNAFDTLLELKNTSTLVRAVTKHRTYKDMVIAEISPPRSAESGDALTFSIALQHVKKVTSQSVEIPPGSTSGKAKGAGEQTAGKTNKGNQTGADPNAVNRSWSEKTIQAFINPTPSGVIAP